MAKGPSAFMSYARFNDQHDDGQLSLFRERLAAEVRAQTGQEFEIFQDHNDIAPGQNWQQRIDETLNAATLLLVMITPSLFKSTACRAELQRFVEREKELGRGDLILPVYYISTLEMDEPVLRESDEMARVLAVRQFADWRELRFEPFTSPVARRGFAQLASRMRDTFWQPPATLARAAGPARATEPSSGTVKTTSATGHITAKNEPPTHVVDAFPGRGGFTTVGAAIEAAKPGDRILVRPGLYEEGLVMDKPLEILGDGPIADIEIRARDANALSFQTTIGRVANLTLRQAGGGDHFFGVDISQGRLDLEGCNISSQGLSCVVIRNGADPRLRRNKIHDGGENGVFVFDGGLGTLEDNDIADGALSGVEITNAGHPTLRRNQIHDNGQDGVYVHDNGLATLEDNDIVGNAGAGVAVRTGGDPTVRHNRINHNKVSAVWIHQNGRATVDDNNLTDNENGASDITKTCWAHVTWTNNEE